MIGFFYKEGQIVIISQRYIGEAVNVEVLDEFGNFDYDFKIPKYDFIKMLNEYLGFVYKEGQAVMISQRYIGEAVNVEVLDEFGNFDYDFKIPKQDFIKLLNEYQKNNNII